MTRSQFEPGHRIHRHTSNQDTGRQSPRLRKPGTPVGPSTNFHATTRYRPGVSPAIRGHRPMGLTIIRDL